MQPYRPRGAADELFACRAPEILIEGPAGTGKSRALLEKCFAVAAKYAGARVLIVRKTRRSMSESVLVTLERDVIPPGSTWLGNASRPTRHGYMLPNGSSIVVGGLDKPDKVMSTEYDLIACYETTELHENDWEMLSTRLRSGRVPYQQIVGDCNPAGPGHWLNLRAKSGRMVRLMSRHEDNPVIWDIAANRWTKTGAEYIAKLDALTGARKDRLRFGRWVAAEGLVYDRWDAGRHLIDRFPIPQEWRRIIAIDFGFNDPFVAQWWAQSDGVMYLYRELYRTRTLVEDHGRRIKALIDRDGVMPEALVCDHDREDRATLERHVGMGTVPAGKTLLDGIQRVSARLAGGGQHDRPRLFIMRDSLIERDEVLADAKRPLSVIDEFDAYAWKKTRDGTAMRDEPMDADNHGLDCTRYAVDYFEAGDPISPTVPTAQQTGSAMTRSKLEW